MTAAPALGRVGVWSAELRRHGDRAAVADAAAELEALGYSALFIPGSRGGDVFGPVAELLDATATVAVATGILNVWMHEPAAVAAAVARLPERFVLGLGISHPALVDRYRRPLATMRAYLSALEPAVPRQRRLLAALGPRMLELARERTAGAHPYFVPVEHTHIARETLGPDAMLAPEQAVLLERDPARARERARTHVAGYMQLPNYTNNLRRLGFTGDDLRDGGSDRLVDAIVAWGDEAAIAERIAAHHAAGADHVCIQVVGVENGALPREEWRRLAPDLVG
jgi:probable F420-dependent oxidoreductase